MSGPEPKPRVHPSAVVDPGAELGVDVYVGPFCSIGPDVRLGDRCRLDSHVSIQGPAVFGSDNRVSPMASLGSAPQDLKYDGEPTRLEVGSHNIIREYVTMNRGTTGGGGLTRIGDHNLFMGLTHIGHDCLVGNRIIFAQAATLAGHVSVEDGATVGAYSGVHQFCRVGRDAFIGGYSVVTQDAMPWITTVGNRAKSYGPNVVGLRRKGFNREQIQALKETYRALFRGKQTVEEGIAEIDARYPEDEHVQYFLSFVRDSERGVTR